MYSLTGRLNTIAFNTLLVLGVLAGLNYLSCYPFSFLGGYDKRRPLITKPFEIKEFDSFVKDNYINEDALSFKFDFEADLKPLINWNTNLIFAYILCEYNTTKSVVNQVTIWDQRIPRSPDSKYVISLKNEFPEYYLTDVNKLQGIRM